jgi:hypothetical protein
MVVFDMVYLLVGFFDALVETSMSRKHRPCQLYFFQKITIRYAVLFGGAGESLKDAEGARAHSIGTCAVGLAESGKLPEDIFSTH